MAPADSPTQIERTALMTTQPKQPSQMLIGQYSSRAEGARIRPHAPHRRLLDLLRLWRGRLRARRELRGLDELDERLLKDIGLTRGDVHREMSKPIWRL
jgi:uncharacterized protein YjiS (DUF1127 family)